LPILKNFEVADLKNFWSFGFTVADLQNIHLQNYGCELRKIGLAELQ